MRAPVAVHNRCQNSSTSQSFDWFDMEPMMSLDAGKTDDMVTGGKNRKEAPLEKHCRGAKYDRRKEKEINKGNECKNEEIVTNLSSRKLTKAELSLLSKGFSFVPTRKIIDIAKVQSDLVEWERRMRLSEYFYDKKRGNNRGRKKAVGEKRK